MMEFAVDVHGRYLKLRKLSPANRCDNLGVAAERVYVWDHQMWDLVTEAMRLFVEERGCGSLPAENQAHHYSAIWTAWSQYQPTHP